ncbi:hypothetical protein [Paenisporosarcina indica]|uniref:hypothetical protein n=1 Tax=Paenisporosarcina indica TaxID=650093 RepID=UPI0009500EB9|nr:hypothetical protein [Paenisporosarcina indica]
MTYATIATHAYPFMHYCISFIFLFILLPKWLFHTGYADWTDKLFAAYVKMVILLILSGYLMVITKLFEVLSLSALFIVIIGYRFIKREQGKKTGTLKGHLLEKLFNLLEGIVTYKLIDIKTKALQILKKWRSTVHQTYSWSLVLEGLALFLVIGGAVFVRFYDAFVNAAPPMADSYVTLAWMKYIDARDLFHDGIYPQGFHIYLATIFKFAAVDALYILRYTGPLNSVLFTLGLYIVIRKLTKNGVGALLSAFIFGIYWVVAPVHAIEVDRQAATNSQEFAFVFIFPAIYFYIKYFLNKHKEDLLVAIICTTIIGLVHSLAFALVGMFIGILLFSALLTMKHSYKSVLHVCKGALLSVIISLVPLGAGYLLGKGFHSSSAEYLVDRKISEYTYRDLTIVDYSALGFCIFLLLCLIISKNTSKERFIGVFTLLVGFSVFTLYYAGGAWSQSTLIASRSRELWGLVMPFCVGISVSYLFKSVKEKWLVIVYIPLVVLFISTAVLYKLAPIIPYKLEHHENIEQYLKIRQEYLPKTWMIVSQSEGYSVSLGTGFHMHLGDFLQTYQSDGDTLTRRDDGKVDRNLTQHVFVFMEKNVFQLSETNSVYELLEPEYKRRIGEYEQLNEWIKAHQAFGNEVTTYYENENIRVYYLQTMIDDPLSIKNMWDR